MVENEKLTKDKMALVLEKEELSRQNGLLQTRIDLLKGSIQVSPNGTHNDNLLLRDSIAMLANNLAGCQKQNEELSRQLNKLQSESNNTKTQPLQESIGKLERLNAICEKNNTLLTRQLESLRGRIQQFNTRQGMWSQRTAYNFLFLTPINTK